MRKSVKIIIYVVLLHLVLISTIVMCVMWWRQDSALELDDRIKMRAYRQRHIECDPAQLTASLEDIFGFDFPKDIQDINSAKTVPISDAVLFIVRFTADPNKVEQLLKSFPEAIPEFRLEPYDVRVDRRKTCGYWLSPEWFTQSIQQGKQGDYSAGFGRLEIYIDSTDDENFIVYMHGSSYRF